MPRSINSLGLAHIRSRVLTLAICYKLVRQDETEMFFTSHSSNVTILSGPYAGTYEASTGVVPSSIHSSVGDGIDNNTLTGIISSDSILTIDILNQVYDGAYITQFLIDYRNPNDWYMILNYGPLGEVSTSGLQFEVEARGLLQLTTQSIVDTTTASCRYLFADIDTCQLNKASFTFTGTVDTVTDNRTFTALESTIKSKATNYFAMGEFRWLTGNNAGLTCDVKRSELTTGKIVFQLATRRPIVHGDTFKIVAGCDHTLNTCAVKFNNAINFGGEPHIRGNDYVVVNIAR